MRKFDIRKWKLRPVSVHEMSDRLLLLNLYLTQTVTFIIGLVWIFLQGRNPVGLFEHTRGWEFALWGFGLAAAVLAVDLAISRWVPEEASDDGGVNEKLFRNRPLWHIAVIAFLASVCEELLFRGAVHHSIGPYWTSVVFAAIHVRYLKHWIPTGLVFGISYSLGWIYERTETLAAPIAAHFLIDFIMGCIVKYRREQE